MGRPESNAGSHSPDNTEAGLNGSQETAVVKPTRSWKGYLWDTWELPPDQRWLLFKLDAFVLTFASVRTYHPARLLTFPCANWDNLTPRWNTGILIRLHVLT